MKGQDAMTDNIPDIPEFCDKTNLAQQNRSNRKKPPQWRLFAGLCCALAALVITACVVLFPAFPHRTGSEIPYPECAGIVSDINPSSHAWRGLPATHFRLANTGIADLDIADMDTGNSTFSQIGYTNLGSFFEYGIDMFVLATVTHIEPGIRQTSTLEIIDILWRRAEEAPGVLPVVQWLFSGCPGEDNTNLLREKGLYLLPLGYETRDDESYWFVAGDWNTLYEIDDQGRVWSHSPLESFNRYDGESADTFIAELKHLFANTEFMAAYSHLGRILSDWTLADITIKSKSVEAGAYYGAEYSYTFSINQILSEPTHDSYDSPLLPTDKIVVYGGQTDSLPLTPGKRYLIFMCRSGDDCFTISANLVAQVTFRNRIKAMPAPYDDKTFGTSLFKAYLGYKVSDFQNLAVRINAWRESFARFGSSFP